MGRTMCAKSKRNEDDYDKLIELANGELFDPLDPHPEDMDPELVAITLGNCCRFGGQIRDFYSVAQHSVLVALLAPKDMPSQKMALLHDADEGFGLLDLPKPLKPAFPTYVEAQQRIAHAICLRYGLTEEDHRRIKPADIQALGIEKLRLKSRGNAAYWDRWVCESDIVDWVRIEPLGPMEARDLFLQAFEEIFVKNQPIDRGWIFDKPGFRIIPGKEDIEDALEV